MPKVLIKQNPHPFPLKQLQAEPEAYMEKLTVPELAKIIEYLSSHYYNDIALVSDDIFDRLQDRLRQLDPNHPALGQVGAPVVEIATIFTEGPSASLTNPKYRVKTELPFWMGSMDKIKPGEASLANWLAKYPGEKVLSDKLDGTSALLVISKNNEMQLFTRGDGQYGQDISVILPYLYLPEIKGFSKPNSEGIVFAVRGELIISKDNFQPFIGEVPNARNLVSGIINSKKIDPELLHIVDLVGYEIIYPSNQKPSEQFEVMSKLGFITPSTKTVATVDENSLIQYYAERHKMSPYEIDGIIVTDNKLHPRNTDGNPKYSFAFKMMIDEATQVVETEVTGVTWEAQKDGYLFPVIHVNPVFVSGVTIKQCSGKNAKFMLDHSIGTGSIVKITRDGEVIPGIYQVITPSIFGFAELPDPIQTPYHWTETHVDIVLDDPNENPDVHQKRVAAFFKQLGVAGLGPGMVAKCIDGGLTTVPNILNATIQDFLSIPGIQEKTATKLHTNIKNAFAQAELETLMVASNAFGRGFGHRRIKLILDHIPDVLDWDPEKLTEKICDIPGYNKKTAEQFSSRLTDFKAFSATLPTKKKLLKKSSLKQSGEQIKGGDKFKDEVVVFTGFRNKEWEDIIKKEGGQVVPNITGKTTLVIVKDENFQSSKTQKAQQMGIPIKTTIF